MQIGTANFINPHATMDVIEGIKNYLADNKIKDINEIIGTFQSLNKFIFAGEVSRSNGVIKISNMRPNTEEIISGVYLIGGPRYNISR